MKHFSLSRRRFNFAQAEANPAQFGDLPSPSEQSLKLLSLLIVALSFALNLHALAGDSFWGDEILTAIFASRSPAEVIDWTAEDIHPPLYYLLAGGFTRLTLPLGASQSPGPV